MMPETQTLFANTFKKKKPSVFGALGRTAADKLIFKQHSFVSQLCAFSSLPRMVSVCFSDHFPAASWQNLLVQPEMKDQRSALQQRGFTALNAGYL